VLPGTLIARYGLAVEHGDELLYPSQAVFGPGRVHRYLLTRQWGTGPALVMVMLNPSTADATRDDQTIIRCKGFARREGCGQLIVVNLFALRSTDPRVLAGHPDPVGAASDAVITWICKPGRPVIAAWSAHGHLNGRDSQVAEMLRDAGIELSCLGVTKSGCPRHPARLPANTPIEPYTYH